MGSFVHVLEFTVAAAATRDLVARVRATMESIELANQRFRGSAILVSDDETKVAIVSEWDDRAAWGEAEWEARIQDAMVDVFQNAEHVESHSYSVAFRSNSGRGK